MQAGTRMDALGCAGFWSSSSTPSTAAAGGAAAVATVALRIDIVSRKIYAKFKLGAWWQRVSKRAISMQNIVYFLSLLQEINWRESWTVKKYWNRGGAA